MEGVLLTRPYQDSSALSAPIIERGYIPYIQPAYTIIPCPITSFHPHHKLDLVLTSKNALLCIPDDIIHNLLKVVKQVYTVGNATAELAQQTGFSNVKNSHGNVESLYTLIVNSHPQHVPLLHLTGHHHRGKLVERLQVQGFSAQRLIVYKSLAVDTIDSNILNALENNEIHHILFFSPRAAKIMINMFEKNKICVKKIKCYCLSQAIKLQASGLDWDAIVVAETPNTQSMLERLKR